MTFNKFFCKKITPFYAFMLVTGFILVFAAFEFALLILLTFGICENCLQALSGFFASVFVWNTIFDVILVDVIFTVALILCNRFLVEKHRREMREFYKREAKARKIKAKRIVAK